jgi:S1-C subfamily serine protease
LKPVNAGGPQVNLDGEVIGVTSKCNGASGVSYAVPATFIVDFMKQVPVNYDVKMDRKKQREAVQKSPVGSYNYLETGLIFWSINRFTQPLLRFISDLPPEVTRGCLVLTVIGESVAAK